MAPHQSRVSCGPESVWPADRDSGSRSCGHCRSPQTLIWCPEEERGGRGRGRGGGKERGGKGGKKKRAVICRMYYGHLMLCTCT